MLKNTLLLLYLFLLFPESEFAREPGSSTKHHSLTYEIGLNCLKEDDLFPIVHRGSINGLCYRFENREKNYNEISVSLRYSKIRAELETEKASQNIQFSFGYYIGFHLVKKTAINYYLGCNLRYISSLVEFPVWDESRAYWATSLTTGLSSWLFINTFKSQSLIIGLDFNPTGIFSRPDEVRLYAQEDWSLQNILKTINSDPKPGFMNNTLISDVRAEYRNLTKKDHYYAFIYSFSLFRICRADEHPYVNSLNNFGISFGF